MNDETLQVITAMTLAFTVLATELEKRAVISKSDLAFAFEQSAELLSPEVASVETSRQVLHLIAGAMRAGKRPPLNA